jgi:hypothetical protein
LLESKDISPIPLLYNLEDENKEEIEETLQDIETFLTFTRTLKYAEPTHLISRNALNSVSKAIDKCLDIINGGLDDHDKDSNDLAEAEPQLYYEGLILRKWRQTIQAIDKVKTLFQPWALIRIESSREFKVLNQSYDELIYETKRTTGKQIDALERQHTQKIKKINKELDETQETINSKSEELDTLITEGKAELNQSMESFRNLQLEKSSSLTAEAYRKHAESERKIGITATKVGIVTLFAGLAALLFAGTNVFSSDMYETHFWESFYLKLSLTLLLSAIATICIRFGSRSLYRANEYTRQYLELASIFALIREDNTMTPEEKQVSVQSRINFFNKSYGRAWENTANGSEEDLGSGELIRILANALSNKQPEK